MRTRGSGLLLHITSLPSAFGIGDLGPQAYAFVDFLAKAKQRFWQILPLNPVSSEYDYSPYSSVSAFAGNPLLISPELLFQQGLLTHRELNGLQISASDSIDYAQVVQNKYHALQTAHQRFLQSEKPLEFSQFCRLQAKWLDDYALFQALKMHLGDQNSWDKWPENLKKRDPDTIAAFASRVSQEISFHRFLQYLFYQQWMNLKAYCYQNRVQIIGDLPIYVSYDSVDVWSQRHFFKLDSEGRPRFVAGVPPDYFSDTGQLWGNPVYDWQALEAKNFSWWIQRMTHNFSLYDFIRIDHFRGLVGYWEVPQGEETAVNGWWVQAPVHNFLRSLEHQFPCLPIIAEDLGEITADVREVISSFDIPNMKVLVFAFDNDNPRHPFLPHTYGTNCVVYTGTHDTNTARGWFEQEATPEARQRLFRYLGKEIQSHQIPWEMLRLGMMSVANYIITPVQDILGLSSSSRMNLPSTSSGNWRWRVRQEDLSEFLANQLADMTICYGRSQ
jgi:4-alpha-glucanotransferase